MKNSKFKLIALLLTVVLAVSALPLYGFVGIIPSADFNVLASAGAVTDAADNKTELPTHALSYASLEPTIDSDGWVGVTLYLNNCVGLESSDMSILYDSAKYEFNFCESGSDANNLSNLTNSFNFLSNAVSDGDIRVALNFKPSLQTSEEYLAADSEAVVNDKHFAAITFWFSIISDISEKDMADDFDFGYATAMFTDSDSRCDISKAPAFASANISRDRTTDTATVTLVLNNCIGLTTLDADLTYNTDKLTFNNLTYAKDTQALYSSKLHEINSYSHISGPGQDSGNLIYSAYFLYSLWSSEKFSDYCVTFDSRHSEVATFNFTVSDDVELTPEDFGFSTVSANFGETEKSLFNDCTFVELLCEHTGGVATCSERAICTICGEEYGELSEHTPSIATCVKASCCTVCGADTEEYAPHVGGAATCTQYAECETCGQPYGELAPHTGGTATADSLAVCEVCLKEYGNFTPTEPVDISGAYVNGKYCVYIYFRNAVGLLSADLQLSFNPEQLSYSSDNYGADALQVKEINEYFNCEAFEATPGQINISTFFFSELKTSEAYAEIAGQDTEININSDNFEAFRIYFDMSDAATAAQEKATVTLTGTCRDNTASYNCADSLFFKAEEHVCHGGRATCQSLAICPDCGNTYGDYAWHVDGDFDGYCDICYTDMESTGFTFELLKDDCLIITGYTGNETKITIPEKFRGITVSSIGDDAFYGCYSIESISIPQNIVSIGERAFTGCANLKVIEADDDNPKFSTADGVLFNKDKTTLICRPQAKSETSYIIPAGVTSIGDDALRNCTALTSVTMPEGLTKIGFYAFYNCENLTTISIPMGVKNIDGFSFGNCTKLKTATLAQGIKSIGEYAFYNCSSLNSISLPDSLTAIHGYAFKDCTTLSAITLPDGLTTIGIGAFENTAYYNKADNYTNGVLYMNKYLIKAMPDTVATDYTVLSGTLLLADSCFANCNKLTKVTVPSNVSILGDEAFVNCSSLKSVTLPDSMSSFGMRIFNGASNDLVLRGTSGSSTQEYATNNGISFEAVQAEHVHTYHVTVVKPSCELGGYTMYTCTSCSHKYTDKPTTALGHNAGDWTVVGSIRVKLCTRCSLIMQSETATVTIDALKSAAWINSADKTLRGVSDNTTVTALRNMFVHPESIEVRDLKNNVIDKTDTKTLLGTGFKISRLSSDGKQIDTVTAIIMGDTDGDAAVSSADARLVLRQSVRLEQLGNAFLTAADIDGAGIAAADARLILRYSVKLESSLIGLS